MDLGGPSPHCPGAADDAGLPERRTHDYIGHGITMLFAALNVAAGADLRIDPPPPRRHVIQKIPGQTRRRGSRRPRCAADLRQLRNPQIAGGGQMACRTFPLPHALRPDLFVLAQPGRTVFALLTDKKLRRGTHRSILALDKDIHNWITACNDTPNPSPGPKPPTRSSNDSTHIVNEFPAHDTNEASLGPPRCVVGLLGSPAVIGTLRGGPVTRLICSWVGGR